jgi:hypothetical protein
MNPEESLEPQQSHSGSGCASCGSSFVEHGYPTPLCSDCRQQFIRYPIPNWIKAFGGAVALVLIFALINLPTQLSLGVHLERGKKAVDEHRFVTAQKELQAFTSKVPESEEGLANLLIASYYNQDFTMFDSIADKLDGRTVEDNTLFGRAQGLIDYSAHYYAADTLATAFMEKYNDYDSIPDTAFANFVSTHDDFWMRYVYSSRLFDKEQYVACDSMLRALLREDPEYRPALRLMATAKRIQDSLELSIKFCNRMLSLNKEDVEAMCLKARTLIKQSKYKEAMDMINKAFAQEKDYGYAKATLALAYHFSKQDAQRDKVIQDMQKDSVAATYLDYIQDVVAGKEKF